MINFQIFLYQDFSEATVTIGVSHAHHCMAANGSRAGAGLHGMGMGLLAGV